MDEKPLSYAEQRRRMNAAGHVYTAAVTLSNYGYPKSLVKKLTKISDETRLNGPLKPP